MRFYSDQDPTGTHNCSNNAFGFRVNGDDRNGGVIQQGDGWYLLHLGEGRSKTFDLYVPGRHASAAQGTPKGCFPIEIEFNGKATAISPPTTGGHMVIYGDSITVGAFALNQPLGGFGGLLKREVGDGGFDGCTTLVAHGYRQLWDDASDGTKRSAFVSFLAGLSPTPTRLVLAIGTNDWLARWANASAFQTAYTALLDAIGTNGTLGSVPLLCISPLLTASPSSREGNPYGTGTMDDYRDAVQAAEAATTHAHTTFLNGKTLLTSAELRDGLHPTTEGHELIYDAIVAWEAGL